LHRMSVQADSLVQRGLTFDPLEFFGLGRKGARRAHRESPP
jgi:hypothetical protein